MKLLVAGEKPCPCREAPTKPKAGAQPAKLKGRSVTYRTSPILLAAVAALLGCQAAAQAPTAATPPVANPGAGAVPASIPAPVAAGPQICLLARDIAVSQSTAGAALIGKLQQGGAANNASFEREQKALAAEQKALQAQGATLAPDVAKRRMVSLSTRFQAAQRAAETRRAQLGRAGCSS